MQAGVVLLLIYEDIINQKVTASMLSKQGCIVEVEDNGTSAIKRVMNSQPYDLIFMDIQMPQM
jgi:CheY-like chemotaxis protein